MPQNLYYNLYENVIKLTILIFVLLFSLRGPILPFPLIKLFHFVYVDVCWCCGSARWWQRAWALATAAESPQFTISLRGFLGLKNRYVYVLRPSTVQLLLSNPNRCMQHIWFVLRYRVLCVFALYEFLVLCSVKIVAAKEMVERKCFDLWTSNKRRWLGLAWHHEMVSFKLKIERVFFNLNYVKNSNIKVC